MRSGLPSTLAPTVLPVSSAASDSLKELKHRVDAIGPHGEFLGVSSIRLDEIGVTLIELQKLTSEIVERRSNFDLVQEEAPAQRLFAGRQANQLWPSSHSDVKNQLCI